MVALGESGHTEIFSTKILRKQYKPNIKAAIFINKGDQVRYRLSKQHKW